MTISDPIYKSYHSVTRLKYIILLNDLRCYYLTEEVVTFLLRNMKLGGGGLLLLLLILEGRTARNNRFLMW